MSILLAEELLKEVGYAPWIFVIPTEDLKVRAEGSCAGHDRQLGGESPLPDPVEVKG